MKRRRVSPPVQQPEAEPSSDPASAEENGELDAQEQAASASPAFSESEDSNEGDRRSAGDEQEVAVVEDDEVENHPDDQAAPAFGAALQRILAPRAGADSILGKHKAVARRVQQERAAAREGQQQRDERRRLLEKDHVGADAADPAAERRLKKLASRGGMHHALSPARPQSALSARVVVRLFNAVAAQRKSQQEEDSASAEDAKSAPAHILSPWLCILSVSVAAA